MWETIVWCFGCAGMAAMVIGAVLSLFTRLWY